MEWDQLSHCQDYLLFPENLGPRLSIDEVNLSNGELYTVVTNKGAKGRKGCLVAIIKGTKALIVSDILMRISMNERVKVREVTLDMSNTMDWIVRQCFPNAEKVSDRFHVQQLVSDALQQMRVKERWKAIEEENEAIRICRENKETYRPSVFTNGDSRKQLLSRSRYLLFKPQSKWSDSQKERAQLLFREYPQIHEGHKLSMMFRSFYHHSKTKEEAKERLNQWYERLNGKLKDRQSKGIFKSFLTAMNSIKAHEGWILNYFPGRATNASAESFNSKLKGFRSLVRGVTDRKFFLFRVAKIYG